MLFRTLGVIWGQKRGWSKRSGLEPVDLIDRVIKLALGGLSAFILFLLTWTCGCWEDEFDEYSADLAADIKSNKNRRV